MALPRRKAGSQAPAHRGGQPRRPVEADNPFTVNEPDVDDDDLIDDVDDDGGYDEDPVYNDSRSQADDGFADENDYADEELGEPAEQNDDAYAEDPYDDGLGSADLEEEPEPEPEPTPRRGRGRSGNNRRHGNSRDDSPRGRGRKPTRQDAPSRKGMMSGFSGLMKSGKDRTKAVSNPQRNAAVEGAAPSSSALLLSVSSSAAGFAIFLFMLGIFLGILHPGSGSLVLVFVLLLVLPFIGLFGGVVSLKKDAVHKSAAITAIVMSLVSILTVGIMYMQMDTITKKIDTSIEQAVSLVNNMNSSSNSLTDEDSGSGHSRIGSSTSKRSSSTGTKSKSNTSSQNQSDSNDDSDSGSSSSSDGGQLKSE